jgi:hypothetical protein
MGPSPRFRVKKKETEHAMEVSWLTTSEDIQEDAIRREDDVLMF